MGNYQLIAATGCPTGIAHTYMAQEALEQAAKKKGITIKVETHGQIGVENELTPEEIKQAEAVIIAADKDVHPERFAGKRIIDVSVSTGIKDAERLLDDALAGKGVLSAENQAVDALEQETGNKTSFGRSIYKNLMNGVSHMLPFVVAGGVLIAISFAVWGIYSFDPDNAQYNATAAMLKSVGDAAMGMMVPVLAAYIAEGIAKRPGLVVGFVGGIVAMNGGTGFLGGILAGFLAGYFILLLQKVLDVLPKQLDGLKAIFLYPVIGVAVIGIVMSLLAGPMKAVNEGMMSFLAGFEHSNPLVLGVIVGCMLSLIHISEPTRRSYIS
ncbi:PTS fructose transporter subunit IIC, partial [uncultured Enterococcus sp.]|uniref:PTS fructose transporter subunit IIC n=1 Tax=uncultured Enterococcus sp. TaxID=167972 RepID=UPI00258DE75E